MTFEIQVVGPGDRQLVRDVYGALRENFAPEELDPEEEFLENLEPFNPVCRVVCVVARHPPPRVPTTAATAAEDGLLDEHAERKLGGLCVWEYFVRSECFLFTYLWIDTQLNGRGLGIQLGLKCWEVANQMRVAADSEVYVSRSFHFCVFFFFLFFSIGGRLPSSLPLPLSRVHASAYVSA